MTDKKQEEVDNTPRCLRCSIGKDHLGRSLGAPIARRDIICHVEMGKSVKVGEIGRCTKKDGSFWSDGKPQPDCNALYNFTITADGRALGLEKAKMLNCLRHSGSEYFTLKELKQGAVDFVYAPGCNPAGKLIDEAVAGLPAGYNPDQHIEQDMELPF